MLALCALHNFIHHHDPDEINTIIVIPEENKDVVSLGGLSEGRLT